MVNQNNKIIYMVDGNFQIGFTRDIALVQEGFSKPILQIEVIFSLPWVCFGTTNEGATE